MLHAIDRIYYINLTHRRDRNEQIQDEFRKMGIPSTQYERFSAIHHREIGGVGCGRSHIAILEDALRKGYNQIMVFEDDFMFCVRPEEFRRGMENLQSMNDWDVCMLAYNMYESEDLQPPTPDFKRVKYAQTVSGYVIRRHYFQKLIDCFKYAVENFEQTNYHWLYAIDVVWKSLQEQDRWICFNPRFGKQRPSFSDCSNTFSDVDW